MIFEWVIFGLTAFIVLGFVVWVIVQGMGSPSKKPWVFDGDTGAKGVYIKWSHGPNTEKGHSDLEFHPGGSVFKKAVIHNIPNAIRDIGVKHSPVPDAPGADKAGYIFLPQGSRGRDRFLSMYDTSIQSILPQLQKQIRRAEIQKRIAEDEAEEDRQGLVSRAKKESEIQGALDKMRKRKSPFSRDEY